MSRAILKKYMETLLPIIMRSLVVYLFIVLAIRIFGKRELTQLSIIDLVFILLISNSVQNAMVGPDTTLLGGLTAATTLFVANLLLTKLLLHSKGLHTLIEGESIMLIYKGKVLTKHLAKAELSHEELAAAVREHGVAHISDVDLAVLENDGNISILSDNYQHRTVKKHKIRHSLHQEE